MAAAADEEAQAALMSSSSLLATAGSLVMAITVLGDPFSGGSRSACSGGVKAKSTISASGPPLRR